MEDDLDGGLVEGDVSMIEEIPGPGEIRPPDGLIVRPSPGRGRGVFATRDFATGATIEVCPVIVLPDADEPLIEQTILSTYYFGWGPDGAGGAFVLGYACLYNHSYEPNARYLRHLDLDQLEIVAIRDIRSGEELTINYNGDPASRAPLWFEPKE
jgi:uncharacterized protein